MNAKRGKTFPLFGRRKDFTDLIAKVHLFQGLYMAPYNLELQKKMSLKPMSKSMQLTDRIFCMSSEGRMLNFNDLIAKVHFFRGFWYFTPLNSTDLFSFKRIPRNLKAVHKNVCFFYFMAPDSFIFYAI